MMTLLYEVLRAGLISGLFYALWRVLRVMFIQSSLDNIPGPPCQSLIIGHLGRLFDRTGWDFLNELGRKYDGVAKLDGVLGAKILFVFDPMALSSIVIKDQYIYDKAEENIHAIHLMLGDGLLAAQGEHHRKQRKMLNPVFSVAHMRHMVPVFYRIAHNLQTALAIRLEQGEQEIDILDWMARTALELVGQAGLGYSFNALTGDKADEYGEAIKAVVPSLVPLMIFRSILPIVMKIGTPTFRRRLLELIPSKAIRRTRDISDLIDEHSRRIFEGKKLAMNQGNEAVLQQIGEGKDILSILMRANMAASKEDALPDEELIAQMSTFIFAGMDTTSGALARILDLLSKHPHVQEKLRAEIIESGNGQDISYDLLVDLPYLDAVCRETLRLYAPVPNIDRRARKDMILPLSAPIRGVDGTLMHEILVPKGTDIMVGILAINRSSALWGPDALEWKPERWLSPLPDSVAHARVPGVYSNLMTFLGGGRSCIGFKFSQLEMKVVLTVLLSTFTFSPSGKDIYWNLAGIQYPTVGTVNSKAEMPLKMGFVKTA